MASTSFCAHVQRKVFHLLVEYTPKTTADLDHIGETAKKIAAWNPQLESRGLRFAGISVTQNPAGRISYETAAAVERLLRGEFPPDLFLLPHITGKDHNLDALRAMLRFLHDAGIRALLVLTGDKPLQAQGVFEVDSLGILNLVRQINTEKLRAVRSDAEFRSLPLLEPGAAVSPFKYTKASGAMQYMKAEKKLREGARFLIAQAGWDSQKSRELIEFAKAHCAPVFGNVLYVDYPIARIMKDLPGCVATDAFLDHLRKEDADGPMRRAALQLAMFQALGYTGAHIGNIEKFEQLEALIEQALAVGNWEDHRELLDFPAHPDSSRSPRMHPAPVLAGLMHDAAFDREGWAYGLARAALKPVEKSREREGPLYHLFHLTEIMAKSALFECRLCGDCYLPEDQFVCTQSQCEKRLPNPPCGDATIEGACGNNPLRPCAAEVIYARARKRGELDRLGHSIHPPRLQALRGTASILNYYFGRSHDMQRSPLEDVPLIQIAELLHASIPNVGTAMRAIEELGEPGYTQPNRGLDVIVSYIESQAALRPAYMDVNIDELGGDTPAIMRRYMRLLRERGQAIPPCVDSSNPEVLRAGLAEWFDLAGERPPLVNSIPSHETQKFMPVLDLRREHEFSIVGMLVDENGPMKSIETMHAAARSLFRLFREKGFRPGQIFFDAVTLGLTFDSCIDSMGEFKPSHTHVSFHAIRKIMDDPEMKGAHTILGVSNWPHGVKKRRIGHIRAFLAAAMQFGLDAAIVDVTHLYGIKPADEELVDLVMMFASLAGDEDAYMTYQEKIGYAREKGWI